MLPRSCCYSPRSPAPKDGGSQHDITPKKSTKQAESQLTTEQKLEDFEYIYKIVEENYCF
ncbi:hypothetical protein DCC85_01850 [Paenibacillus sp. CAA11]|nr:hypothetical protein DCC85_01850 [Paenibacillus sp. CAA11]